LKTSQIKNILLSAF